MKKQNLVSLAIGSAFAAVALTPIAHAADNPFSADKLEAGYQLAQADTKTKDGKCGEGKCGGKTEMKQNMEGKCGGKKAEQEGKCGEGKCGSSKK